MGQSKTMGWLLLGSETLLLSTHTKKDDSKCWGSALWQSSDRVTLLTCADKQFPFSLSDFLLNLPNSFLVCFVDECVVLCWALCLLPELHTTLWNCCLLIKSISRIYTKPSQHIILLWKLSEPREDVVLKSKWGDIYLYILPRWQSQPASLSHVQMGWRNNHMMTRISSPLQGISPHILKDRDWFPQIHTLTSGKIGIWNQIY